MTTPASSMRGQLPKAYLRIDPNLDTHPDPEAMLMLILWANRQPHRGRFKSLSILERVLSKKRLRAALARGDISQLSDAGGFYLVGWDEWQEGDITVGERQSRIRQLRTSHRYSAVTEPPVLHDDVTNETLLDRDSPSEASRRLGVKASPTETTETDSSAAPTAAPEPPAGVEATESPPGPVEAVFSHWRVVMNHPNAILTAERRRAVKARLREGYTVEQLVGAIDGCRRTPWNMGQNNDQRVYDELELICRKGTHVERFLASRRATTPPARAAPAATSVDARNTEALRQFMARREGNGQGPCEGEGIRDGPRADRQGLPPGGRRSNP